MLLLKDNEKKELLIGSVGRTIMKAFTLTEKQHQHVLGLAVDELNCLIKLGADEARVENIRELVAIIDNAEEVEHNA